MSGTHQPGNHNWRERERERERERQTDRQTDRQTERERERDVRERERERGFPGSGDFLLFVRGFRGALGRGLPSSSGGVSRKLLGKGLPRAPREGPPEGSSGGVSPASPSPLPAQPSPSPSPNLVPAPAPAPSPSPPTAPAPRAPSGGEGCSGGASRGLLGRGLPRAPREGPPEGCSGQASRGLLPRAAREALARNSPRFSEGHHPRLGGQR